MKKMIRYSCSLIGLLLALGAGAQEQKGYVKTKGVLMPNNQVKPGERVSGVLVSIKGMSNRVVSQGNRGAFSFRPPANTFYLQGIEKEDYQLADPEATSQPHNLSATSPLIVVVEKPDKRRSEQAAAVMKIRKSMNLQLQKREEEIERLREQNRISEEEKTRLQEQLDEQQAKQQGMIREMANYYVSTDYDFVDPEQRLINQYILEGLLDKADSLLGCKGTAEQRINKLREEEAEREKRQKAYEEQQRKVIAMRASLAEDLYSKYVIAAMRYQNDSAMYYLEKRIETDTTNVKWMLVAALFAMDYLADYNRAMTWLDKAEIVARLSDNPYYLADTYLDKMAFYIYQRKSEKALDYISLIDEVLRADSTRAADVRRTVLYSNMATIYDNCYMFDESMKYYEKVLEADLRLWGEESQQVAYDYQNMGTLFNNIDQFDQAIGCFEKAQAIFENQPERYQMELSSLYNGFGVSYKAKRELDKALDYFQLSFEIRKKMLEENHPGLATNYINMAGICVIKADFVKAANYYEKAQELYILNYGEKSDYLVDIYGKMAAMYEAQDDFRSQADYLQKCYQMSAEVNGIDVQRTRAILPNLYIALAQLVQHQPSEENRRQFQEFLADKVVTATVMSNGPAEQMGLKGEYVLMEYCDWTIVKPEECVFMNFKANNEPKDLVLWKDGQMSSHHFDGRIGVGWMMKVLQPGELAELIGQYRQWKKE